MTFSHKLVMRCFSALTSSFNRLSCSWLSSLSLCRIANPGSATPEAKTEFYNFHVCFLTSRTTDIEETRLPSASIQDQDRDAPGWLGIERSLRYNHNNHCDQEMRIDKHRSKVIEKVRTAPKEQEVSGIWSFAADCFDKSARWGRQLLNVGQPI